MEQETARELSPQQAPSLPQVPEHEVEAVLNLLRPLVDAIGQTVGPHCEVVLHDLRIPERSIVAIRNGSVTGRRVGGPLVGGPINDIALKLLDSEVKDSSLLIGYKTHARDNLELRATSLVLRTPQGKPVIALCINIDLSTLSMARMLLEEISKPVPSDGSTEEASQRDVDDIVAQVIREALDEAGKAPKFMDREDRLHAVRLMHERGLFLVKGGVERASAALGISRFTLYGYLKEIRHE